MKLKTPNKDEIKQICEIAKANGVVYCKKGPNKYSPVYIGRQTVLICDTVYKNILKKLNAEGFYVEGQDEYRNVIDVLMIWKIAE